MPARYYYIFSLTTLKFFTLAICIVRRVAIIKRRTIPCCDLRLDWFVKTCLEIPFKIRSPGKGMTRKASAVYQSDKQLSVCLGQIHTSFFSGKSQGFFNFHTPSMVVENCKFMLIWRDMNKSVQFKGFFPCYSSMIAVEPRQINLTYAFRSATSPHS